MTPPVGGPTEPKPEEGSGAYRRCQSLEDSCERSNLSEDHAAILASRGARVVR